jgi:hypothetical protein
MGKLTNTIQSFVTKIRVPIKSRIYFLILIILKSLPVSETEHDPTLHVSYALEKEMIQVNVR